MEVIARQLLLLNISLNPLGLEQKTKTFMELYGNALVRPSVAKILTGKANELVKMVTDYQYLSEYMPNVKLNIKYKDRDYLEQIFKFWCGRDEFNVCDCWDRRLRRHLGVRYDSRLGAFDWDLHMRLHPYGAQQICNQEYRSFRQNGVAFTWLESEVSKPNRSYVCGIIPNGEKYLHYGYLGDMNTGPFIAYGLECEDKEFLKSTHGQNVHRATDVTERNLKQIFYEIKEKEEYLHKPTTDYQLGQAVLRQEKLVVDVKPTEIICKSMEKCLELEGVEINFISLSMLEPMKRKEQFKNYFHLTYYSSVFFNKYFDKDLVETVGKKGESVLLIENQRLIVSCNRKEQLQEYGKKVKEQVESFKTISFNQIEDNVFKFTH